MHNLLQRKPVIFSWMFSLVILSTFALFSCTPDDPTPPPPAPDAAFTYTSTRVFPVQINFVNASTSSIPGPSTYIWDFGDGTFSTVVNPAHVYTVAGVYLVRLVQIYSNSTRDTLIKAIQLNPTGPTGTSSKTAGIAATDFTFSIPSVYTVSFTNTSSNSTSYLWDFGDSGSSSSAATTVTHQYNTAGPFMVKLKASGPGGTDSCSTVIGF